MRKAVAIVPKRVFMLILIATSILLIGCNAHMALPESDPGIPQVPGISETPTLTPIPPQPGTPEHDPSLIRLSEDLYIPEISTSDWKPYFTGDEPLWGYNPDEPWASFKAGDLYAYNQTPGTNAYQALYYYLTSTANYAGSYINCNGYLTILLTNPAIEQANEISEKSPTPVWIISAKFPYATLSKALDEGISAMLSWTALHPDVSAAVYSGGVYDDENRVRINMQGSGVPQLLSAFDLPDCIKVEYTPIPAAAEPHDIPHEPATVWEKDGVTIRSARDSYPVGTKSLLITASHNVEGKRLYAPSGLISVEKYMNGEWYNISGNFVTTSEYTEIFNIPAGEDKTVELDIVAPETLGPGLYRATFPGHVWLSATGDWDINDAITGIDWKDRVIFEFAVTIDDSAGKS